MLKLTRVRTLTILTAGLGLLAFGANRVAAVSGGVTVTTLAGGPYLYEDIYTGYNNGPSVNAQFNGPYGCALDSMGNLYIADKNNRAVRMMVSPTNKLDGVTSTLLRFTSPAVLSPVGVAVDNEDNLYIATAEKSLLKYNLATRVTTTLATFVAAPTGVTAAQDGSGTAYVSLANGNICGVTTGGATLLYTFQTPLGIAWMPGGKLAISDGYKHSIWLLDPTARTAQWLAGNTNSTTGGFADGSANTARFNKPCGLAAAGSGTLIVADQLNHRVRLVGIDGTVSTLCGMSSTSWGSVDYPGWLDTAFGVPQSRQPYAVAVSPNGEIFVTELYYHLVRIVTGSGLSSQIPLPTAPVFSPAGGYFLNAQTITVTNGFGEVHYTTNGTEPTVTSPKVTLISGAGTIIWNDRSRDLTSLRMKSFSGTNSSVTVGGQIIYPTTPVLFPASGYYPQGQTIVVSNNVGIVLYTTDNTEPVLGISPAVSMVDGVGVIQWSSSLHDLSWLRVKAFNGINIASPTVAGKGPAVSVPSMDPSSGYFLTPRPVTVINPSGDVYYTFNGYEEPTMNSPRVPMTNGIGTILFTGDLSLLRLKAFSSPDSFSVTVAGESGSVTTPTVRLVSSLPNCITITVSNTLGDVFYTMDGSEPNLSSLCVSMANGIGVLQLSGTVDLSLMRFKAFSGPNTYSPTVSFLPTTPVVSPLYGYCPSGQRITVSNAVGQVFYTTDGSEPTTASLPVSMTNGIGSFFWSESLNDLSSMRVKAFCGSVSSLTVSGQAAPRNEIGITRDVSVGVKSFVYVPIVVNMVPGQSMNTIMFNIEVTPTTSTQDPVAPSFKMLDVDNNRLVPLVGPAPDNALVDFRKEPYYTSETKTRGIRVYAASTNSGFAVQRSSALGVLEIEMPASARQGQSYKIKVHTQSAGTGIGVKVPLATMPSRFINVTNIEYMAGDVLPKGWYGASEFGDAMIDVIDVNAVLYAAFNVRAPYRNSEAYNAMCVADELAEGELPSKPRNVVMADWLEMQDRPHSGTNVWIRYRDEAGVLRQRQAVQPEQVSQLRSFSKAMAAPLATGAIGNTISNTAWNAQVSVTAGIVDNLQPGQLCSMPVYVKALAGSTLNSFGFRATLESDCAPLPGFIELSPAGGIPVPSAYDGLNANDRIFVWSRDPMSTEDYTAKLQRTHNLVGYIKFRVPSNAEVGQSYVMRLYADGVNNLNKMVYFETFFGLAVVGPRPAAQRPVMSSEWLVHYFGSTTAPDAVDSADPDADGLVNWKEYLAGTDPTRADSRFEFASAVSDVASKKQVTLSWLTAQGRSYVVESSSELGSTNWNTEFNVVGDGNLYQLTQTNLSSSSKFYRVRLQ